ncbi:hypothetical protein CR513_14844, partial [Mucuna pruriens]
MGLFVANMICLYVDDLIFIGNNPNLFEDFKKVMSCEFEMTDIGLLSYYLILEVKQMNKTFLFLKKAMQRRKLKDLTNTRPNIMYAVGVVCRFVEAPTSTHMKTTNIILCYLKGTHDFGLFYSSSNEKKYYYFCVFTWNSKKQAIVTLSTCEAEYVAATSCMCQDIWIRRLLKEFNMN